MQTLAYLASALIGISLGLIGGGGSIMTVPVLVYLFGINPIIATSYSLFIVGSTSLVGAVNSYRKGSVNIPVALFFGISSVTTVFLTRKFVVPTIPQHIAQIGPFDLTNGMLTMVLFAILMIVAAIAMTRSHASSKGFEPDHPEERNFVKAFGYGVGIGLSTGILGAGGGFLLIPTLVILLKLPMKKAVGTSLLIIAMNSLIGFTGDLGHFTIDWVFLSKITGMAVTGIFTGGYLNKKIDGSKLKKGFGWFVLVMGTYIIIREIFMKYL